MFFFVCVYGPARSLSSSRACPVLFGKEYYAVSAVVVIVVLLVILFIKKIPRTNITLRE